MREELLHAIAREHCLELSDDDRVRRCVAEKGRGQRRLQASHDGLEFFNVVVGILCTRESHENALLKHSINGKLPDWFRSAIGSGAKRGFARSRARSGSHSTAMRSGISKTALNAGRR